MKTTVCHMFWALTSSLLFARTLHGEQTPLATPKFSPLVTPINTITITPENVFESITTASNNSVNLRTTPNTNSNGSATQITQSLQSIPFRNTPAQVSSNEGLTIANLTSRQTPARIISTDASAGPTPASTASRLTPAKSTSFANSFQVSSTLRATTPGLAVSSMNSSGFTPVFSTIRQTPPGQSNSGDTSGNATSRQTPLKELSASISIRNTPTPQTITQSSISVRATPTGGGPISAPGSTQANTLSSVSIRPTPSPAQSTTAATIIRNTPSRGAVINATSPQAEVISSTSLAIRQTPARNTTSSIRTTPTRTTPGMAQTSNATLRQTPTRNGAGSSVSPFNSDLNSTTSPRPTPTRSSTSLAPTSTSAFPPTSTSLSISSSLQIDWNTTTSTRPTPTISSTFSSSTTRNTPSVSTTSTRPTPTLTSTQSVSISISPRSTPTPTSTSTSTSTVTPKPTPTATTSTSTLSTPTPFSSSSTNPPTSTTTLPSTSTTFPTPSSTSTSVVTSSTTFPTTTTETTSTTLPSTSMSTTISSTTTITSTTTPTSTSTSTPTSTTTTTTISPTTASNTFTTTTTTTPTPSSTSTPSSTLTPTSTTIPTTPTSTTIPTTSSTASPTTSTTLSTSASTTPISTSTVSSSASSSSTSSVSSSPSSTTLVVISSTATPSTTVSTLNTSSPIGSTYVQIVFCNLYKDVVPTNSDLSSYLWSIQVQLAQQCKTTTDRIREVTIMQEPNSGRLVVQFLIAEGDSPPTAQILATIKSLVYLSDNPLQLIDIYQRVLYVHCDDIRYLYNWTDYGPCPYRPCYNGGKCGCRPAGQFYCLCKNSFSGTFCENPPQPDKEKEGTNYWPLLTIPAAIALLLLILGLIYCCKYCCHCYCAWCPCCVVAEKESVATATVIEVPVIETVEPDNVYSDLRLQSVTTEPQNVFYHAVGRPFAVAFNDNSFSGASSTIVGPNDRFYTGTAGKKMAIVYEDIGTARNLSECGGACGTTTGSAFADSDSYYHALGQKLAIAFNDRSFNTYQTRPRHQDRTRLYFN